jgi:hypothetical protein
MSSNDKQNISNDLSIKSFIKNTALEALNVESLISLLSCGISP